MSRPTQEAEMAFRRAKHMLVGKDTVSAAALSELAEGLINLSQGLRATYLLLEEVRGPIGQHPSNAHDHNAYVGFKGLESRRRF